MKLLIAGVALFAISLAVPGMNGLARLLSAVSGSMVGFAIVRPYLQASERPDRGPANG